MSNEIEVVLPLESDHIRLPPAELRVDDEDLYREYLEVTEGSGSVDTGRWNIHTWKPWSDYVALDALQTSIYSTCMESTDRQDSSCRLLNTRTSISERSLPKH